MIWETRRVCWFAAAFRRSRCAGFAVCRSIMFLPYWQSENHTRIFIFNDLRDVMGSRKRQIGARQGTKCRGGRMIEAGFSILNRRQQPVAGHSGAGPRPANFGLADLVQSCLGPGSTTPVRGDRSGDSAARSLSRSTKWVSNAKAQFLKAGCGLNVSLDGLPFRPRSSGPLAALPPGNCRHTSDP